MKTPKFDSQLPVENWIVNMKLYGKCSNITDADLLSVALSQILMEESGTSLIEAITEEEKKDWESFKTKLIQVLGKDKEHFKYLYTSFQRGQETQQMAVTKLQAYFKKGYGKLVLDAADESIICDRFIECQDPRLAELLRREKSLLNLQNIAQRAMELERSFYKRENIFAAECSNNAKESEIAQLCSQLKEIVASAKEPVKEKKRKTRARIPTDKLQGHCIAFVRNGRCRFGEKCKYLHSETVPEEVEKIIKKEA